MTCVEFQCSDHPVIACFQAELTPGQAQRLKIMSRSRDHRCADVCEEVANMAETWGNSVYFTLPSRPVVIAKH